MLTHVKMDMVLVANQYPGKWALLSSCAVHVFKFIPAVEHACLMKMTDE